MLMQLHRLQKLAFVKIWREFTEFFESLETCWNTRVVWKCLQNFAEFCNFLSKFYANSRAFANETGKLRALTTGE